MDATNVMAGLVPAIYDLCARKDVDAIETRACPSFVTNRWRKSGTPDLR